MALESTPKVLQRTPIPILNRGGMGFLWSERVDPSKMQSKGSRALRRQVIGKLTCWLQNAFSQKTSLWIGWNFKQWYIYSGPTLGYPSDLVYDPFWAIYGCFKSRFHFFTFSTYDFDSLHSYSRFLDIFMAKLNWQEDTPCQADHFGLLKLLKRSKNTKVMAILRSVILLPKYSRFEFWRSLCPHCSWHEIAWNPQIMCSGKDYKHTVLVGAIGGLLRAI